MSTFRSHLIRPFHTAIVILLVFSTLPLPAAARAIAPRAGSAAEPAPAVALPPFDEGRASIMPAWHLAGTVELQEDSHPSDVQVEAGTAWGDASLMFVENVGQFPDGAHFQVRGGDRTVWLAEDSVWVTVVEPVSPTLPFPPRNWDRDVGLSYDPDTSLRENEPRRGVNLKLSFPGANTHAHLEPFNRLDTRVSFFLGNDPAQWRADVPAWGGVRYVDLYPGVDLEIASEGGRWAWQLVCRADCQSTLQGTRLRVDGADALALEALLSPDGGGGAEPAPSAVEGGEDLRLTTAVGDFVLPLLQVVDTSGTSLNLGAAQPEVNGLEVVSPFVVPFPAKHGLRVEIAPSENQGAVLPAVSADQGNVGNLSNLFYSTFLGGSDGDYAYGIVVDGAGSAYVTGSTTSSGFPTSPGAFDTDLGLEDAFVVKLNADGTGLEYATFLGGDDTDGALGIAIDESGNAYVTGWTDSSDFPTTSGAFDRTCGTDGDCNRNNPVPIGDAFVVKLNTGGTDLDYATFLGGSAYEAGEDIVTDSAGNAYVTGNTGSYDFPVTPGAFDTACGSDGYCNPDLNGYPRADVFAVKVNASGTALAYGTFLGGSGADYGRGIAVNGGGNAYVTGVTHRMGQPFPTTPGAFDTEGGGLGVIPNSDAFVTMLSADGTGLVYSTYLSSGYNGGHEAGNAIAVDGAGNAYVAGETNSLTFPTTPGAFDTSYNGGYSDLFVVKMNAGGTGLLYGTYLGGSGDDYAYGVALDEAGNAHVTGDTTSSDFPTTAGAFDSTCGSDGNCDFDDPYVYDDAFVAKLNASGTDLAYGTFLGGSDVDGGEGITVAGIGNTYVAGHSYSTDFPTTPGAFDSTFGGDSDAFTAVFGGLPSLPCDQTLSPCECPFGCSTASTGWTDGSINTGNGNYHYGAQDFSIPALGEPLRFERSYSAQSAGVYTTTLGAGWTHDYDLDLTFPGDPGGEPGTVIVKGCRGSRFRLADNGDGTYDAFSGVWATLTRTLTTPYTYTLVGVDQSTYVFDDAGHLVGIHSPQGPALTLSYDDGRLARVADGTGQRYLDFSYDGEGRLAEVRDPINRTVRYGYGVAGDLAVVTDTRGLAWTYTYTGTHLLYDVRDPLGQTVERTDYDGQGRAVRQWQGTTSGQPLQIQYGANGVITVTDQLGHATVDGYNTRGVLAAQSDAAGSSSRAYDTNFNWTSTTDANERTTRYAFNAMGQPERVTDALENTTRMAYDSLNHLTAVTDTLERATRYEYQGNLLTAITDALDGAVVNTYDERGLLIQVVDHGITTTYGYDAWGQRVAVTDTLGHVTTYGYDAVGQLITTTVPGGLVSVNGYDAGDNLVRVTRNYTSTGGQNYLGMYNLVTWYGYDAAGRRVVTTDTLGLVACSWYNAAGRPISVTTNYSPTIYPGHGPGNDWNLTTRYGYDAIGRQILVTDTLGGVSYTEYDAVGRVARTWQNYLPGQPQNYQGVYNLVTAYGYDAVGNQVLVTDTLGHVTYTEYDELNRVLRVWQNYLEGYLQNYQDTYNLVTEYGYDAVGNQVWVADALWHVTYTEYDALNRPVTVTANYVDGVFDPAYPDEDLVRVTTYDEAGRVLQVTQHGTRNTRYEYDALGRQTAVVQNYEDGVYDPAQPDRDLRSETVYNDLGQVAARVQVVGERITTTFEYDAIGRLITTTNALSGASVTHYDALGRRTEIIDVEGNRTRYAYDAARRLVTTTNALSGTFVTRYDALGRRVATTDPLSHTTVYTTNAAGRLVAQADPLGAVTRYGYDALGRRTVITDADGVALYSVYDSLGRLVRTQDAGGNATRYGYDAIGNRVVMTDANSVATRYEYDDLGRLAAVVENYQPGQPADQQTNVLTEYTYDDSGNLAEVIDALTHTTVYTYDLAGRRVAEANPLSNVTQYQYDGLGRRVGEVYPDEGGPITVTTAYNALGWPTQIDYPTIGSVPGFSVAVSYDALGNREVVTDATGATTYDYSALYQPLGIAAPTGDAHYTYDAAGQRVNLVYPTGEVVTYTHDAAGRLVRVQDWAGGATVYTYTAAGRLSGIQLPNGVKTQYAYDGAGRLVKIEHRRGVELLARYEYRLDSLGNRVVVTETVAMPAEGGYGAFFAGPDTLSTQASAVSPLVAGDVAQLAGDAAAAVAPSGWLETVQETIRRSEYDVSWQEQTHLGDVPTAYQAPNRTHNLRTYFTPAGIRVIPRTSMEDTPAWELGLALTGYGAEGDVRPAPAAELSTSDNRIEYRYESADQRVSEWYVNDERGLEQGFTIATPPLPHSSAPLLLELVLSGDLTPNLTEDGSAVEFTTQGGVRVLRYSDLRVTDATGRSLPAHLELARSRITHHASRITPDVLRITLDASSAVYPLTIDPLLTSPSWTAESNQANANFGYAVGTAGDVNGDGYADVIIGAYRYDNGQTDEGRAYVYTGTVSGLGTNPAWTAESNQASAYFGAAVGTAGDVNKDGYGDVIVGAHRYDNGQTDEGRAFVYTGTVSGLGTTAAWTAESNQASAYFGYSVGTAGDVNKDGYGDVIVGAYQYDNGQTDEGRAYVYTGTVAGLRTTAAWTAESNQASANFGYAVGTAGDVNKDGYADVIVGAYRYDNGQTDEGRAYVYTGTVAGLRTTAAWTGESNQASANFGYSVGAAGDVNGDGYGDVIVGAYRYDNGQTDEGRAFVYTGTVAGLGANPAWTAESNQASAYFGAAVGTAGDVNKDGYADVIVGAYRYDVVSGTQTFADTGRAYVYTGTLAGLGANADWTATCTQTNAYFGYAVGTAGDVNKDGYADVIVGAYGYSNGQTAEGRVYVYRGYTPDTPIAGLSATNDGPTPLGQPTTLTATVTAGSNVAYAWRFGDDATGSGQVVTHTYAAAGAYTAVVTASNSVSVMTATTWVTVTGPTARVITYTYDPLNRLTGATYSTGESFAYAYDTVGNRTAYTATIGSTTVTTYTYDAANRLTTAGGVAYTWDKRGNLTSDGVFTYTYNAAGRLVRAESITVTLVYTYTAGGLRVGQSVDGDVTEFAWDWASGLPELLSDGDNLYLVGHDTLGWWDGAAWSYTLPDALGSIRQVTDETGAVTDAREWTPYGAELGGAQAGLGYTGEWQDAALGLMYLRARWYDGESGRFMTEDLIEGDYQQPLTMNPYLYALANPSNFTDRTGLCTMCTEGSSVTAYDSWSCGQGVALRREPSLEAPVIGRIPNGSRVTIREDAPVLASGIDWHSSDISLFLKAPGSPPTIIRAWIPNQSLMDNLGPDSYPDIADELRFNRPPVAIGSVTSVQGFGATRHAFNDCSGTCLPCEQESDCTYRRTRGIHNGLDFSVPNGTVVYWTGNSNGFVVNKFPNDASPNVVISAGPNYYVLFGELSEVWVQENQFIWGGQESTPVGRTGHGHLHLGVRTTSKFYNPLYFFESTLANRLVDMMGGYIEGEDPWSILAYEYSAGCCGRYFWDCNGCNADRTGIDRP